MQAAKAVVESLISRYPVAVFSKSYCPYCSRAKNTLQASFAPNTIGIVELDDVDNGSVLQAALADRAGKSRVTVPQVYIQGKLVGGNDDLQSFAKTSKFEDLVKSIQAGTGGESKL